MKLFVDNRVYTWGNIKNTTSGKKAVDSIKATLEKIIVKNKNFSSADKERVIDLVTKAAKEHNAALSKTRQSQ